MSTSKVKKRKKRCPNGAIRQNKDGTFTGRVPMGFTGERYVYKIVTGKSKADVKKQVEQLKLKKESRKCRDLSSPQLLL